MRSLTDIYDDFNTCKNNILDALKKNDLSNKINTIS